MKIYTSLAKYESSKNFTAWVLTVAKNHLIDAYRKTKREKSNRENFSEHLQARIELGPEAEMMVDQSRELIWKGLGQLSPEIRLAIILKEINSKSYEEVAQIMNIPVGTVKSRISRGKMQLARLLSQEG